MRKYLLWCANEHIDFRIPEICSLAEHLNVPLTWIEKPKVEVRALTKLQANFELNQPWAIVSVPEENYIKKLMSRSILIKSCLELWGRGGCLEEVHESVKKYPEEYVTPFCQEDVSFRVKVESFCRTLKHSERLERIESFSYLPFKGPVKLKDPDVSLHLLEFWGLDPNKPPPKPLHLFFGRWICDSARGDIFKINLKTRKYIGSTSMDPQLSLIMANMAAVLPGDLVLDPFVGTGSLLVAVAHFGGYVMGTDISYLTLHGKTKPTRYKQKKRSCDESIRANLKQYKLEQRYIDVVAADASLPLWRTEMKLDAVITDPPYGIREATEKIGTEKNYKIAQNHKANHIPAKVSYCPSDIYRDLLTFSAINLRVGGRVVFWFPVFRDEYTEDQLPRHPCLDIVANSEQIITCHSSRRLLTMQKTREPTSSDQCAIYSSHLADNFKQKYFQAIEISRKDKKQKAREINKPFLTSSYSLQNDDSDK